MINSKIKSQFKYIFIILIILCTLITVYRINSYISVFNVKQSNYKMKVIDFEIDGNKLSVVLKNKEKLLGNYYFKTATEKAYFEKELNLGDNLFLEGLLKIPNKNSLPNTFNYKNYLRAENIFWTLDIQQLEIKEKNKNYFYKIKNYILKTIALKKHNDYIMAFVLGDTDYINSEIYQKYKRNGVAHLFSVSGMHISFLTLIIFLLFSFFRIRERNKYIFTFFILIFFAFLSGFKPSVLRSVIFFTLLGINKLNRLNINNLYLLILTLIIVLFIDPFKIFSISLHLSFIVTFFIIYYMNFEKVYFESLINISVISFFASLPLIVNLNYEINLLSIINNIILVPLVSIIIYPLCLFNLLLPIDFILTFFINILDFLNNLLFSLNLIITVPKAGIFAFVTYYFLLLLNKYFKNRTINILFLILFIYSYVYPILNKNSYVYFLDVGQGDCALLVSKHRKEIILIDTGGTIKYKKENWEIQKKTYDSYNNIETFLKSLGINKINYVFLTHEDYDHVGNIYKLKSNFKIENIIINKGENKLKLGKEINFEYKEIQDFKIYNLDSKKYDNENENSLILYIKIFQNNFLLMGDASIKNEKVLLEKYDIENIDVLKLGHHGSSSSSSYEFLNQTNPKNSIISAGKNNRYKHPSQSVIDNLVNLNLKYYNTSIHGTIYYEINKNSIKQFYLIK